MMGQGGQGSSMMGQRPMAPYRPSQQGKAASARGEGPLFCVSMWEVMGLLCGMSKDEDRVSTS